jgi:hypothetical protein
MKKRLLKEWVFMNDEQQSYFDGNVNNFTMMVHGIDYQITHDEVIDSIEYYFSV